MQRGLDLLNSNQAAAAMHFFVAAGIVREELQNFAETPELLDDLTQLRELEAVVLFFFMMLAGRYDVAGRLGQWVWDQGNTQAKQHIYKKLTSAFLLNAQREEAGVIYLESLAAGFQVVDYRPRWDGAALFTQDQSWAERLFSVDRRGYDETIAKREKAATWPPIIRNDGTILLRGASAENSTAKAAFRYRPLNDRTSANQSLQSSIVEATIDSKGGGLNFWTAATYDLLPGREYEVSLIVEDGAQKYAAPSRIVAVPILSSETVVTGDPDIAGFGRVVFCGVVASLGIGSKYRFEYGPNRAQLINATPWEHIPPPRQAQVRDVAHRHFGNWIPRSTGLVWRILDWSEIDPKESGISAAIRLISPFSKDRNQLSGIGSHEMPLNFSWCNPHDSESETILQAPQPTLSVGGGTMDLRDAEFVFTVRGENLNQKGAILTFWPLRAGKNEHGTFGSQWATTGDPFPDDALEDGRWHRVAINLTNDPRRWTYTGNNPQEQGERARRYQKLPLDQTLIGNDGAFVLIFALGEERNPPNGTLEIFDVSARYRSHSLLSPAAGAVLSAWPRVGTCDPMWLTDGSRGIDEFLWVSASSPPFPLEFAWNFPNAIRISHVQINQHPYWPSRTIEVVCVTPTGGERLLWSGVLSEGRPDRGEPPYSVLKFNDELVSGLKLRILSGFHEERCGLDGIEVYGTGADFTGDGLPCTVSCEAAGLDPGTTVFVRLVMEEGGEMYAGEVKSIALPRSRAPQLLSAYSLVRKNNPACFCVRGNAMGLETEVWSELLLPSGESYKGPSVSLGMQENARHLYYEPRGMPQTRGQFRLHARNAEGEHVLEVPWPLVSTD